MKKTAIALLLLLPLISCKKTACYKCKIVVITHYGNGEGNGVHSEKEYCDLSIKDVNKIQDDGNYHQDTVIKGQKVSINVYTECDKK